jgi:hypothetical protein
MDPWAAQEAFDRYASAQVTFGLQLLGKHRHGQDPLRTQRPVPYGRGDAETYAGNPRSLTPRGRMETRARHAKSLMVSRRPP